MRIAALLFVALLVGACASAPRPFAMLLNDKTGVCIPEVRVGVHGSRYNHDYDNVSRHGNRQDRGGMVRTGEIGGLFTAIVDTTRKRCD